MPIICEILALEQITLSSLTTFLYEENGQCCAIFNKTIPHLQVKKKSVFSANSVELDAESRGHLTKLGIEKQSLYAVAWVF